MKLSEQLLINIINSRLGKYSLKDLVEYNHNDKYLPEWESFMAGKDCSKEALCALLINLKVIIKYGNDIKTAKKIAKFKLNGGKTAREFIGYINKLNIDVKIFRIINDKQVRINKNEPDVVSGWVPDKMNSMQKEDPYVALGID